MQLILINERAPAKCVAISSNDLDLAIVQVEASLSSFNTSCVPITFSNTPVVEGDAVYVVGHGLFAPHLSMLVELIRQWSPPYPSSELSPMATTGVASRVIYDRGTPLIIMTDANVYGGVSGGLLLNGKVPF